MHRVFKRAAAAVSLAALLLGAGQAAAAPALWAVKDEDSTIYLFGTVHVIAPDTAWRTLAYDAAYREAAEVWLEADVFSNPEQTGAQMAMEGLDEEGRLEQRIGRRDFGRVVKALKPLGFDRKVARNLEPWFAAVLIMAANLQGSGIQSETGAEATSSASAATDGKALRYFETVGDQLAMLAGLSEATQVEFLREVLSMGKQTPKVLDAMTDAWVAGDDEKLIRELVLEMKRSQPEVYDAMLRRRNLAWADKLDAEMKGSGVDLVTVGAAHLLGDDGLPALLRARGYRVERVQ